jgi:hypothetical protein
MHVTTCISGQLACHSCQPHSPLHFVCCDKRHRGMQMWLTMRAERCRRQKVGSIFAVLFFHPKLSRLEIEGKSRRPHQQHFSRRVEWKLQILQAEPPSCQNSTSHDFIKSGEIFFQPYRKMLIIFYNLELKTLAAFLHPTNPQNFSLLHYLICIIYDLFPNLTTFCHAGECVLDQRRRLATISGFPPAALLETKASKCATSEDCMERRVCGSSRRRAAGWCAGFGRGCAPRRAALAARPV